MKRLRRALGVAAYLLGVAAFFEGSSRVLLSSDAFFGRVAGEDDASWRLRWVRRHSGKREIYYAFDVFDSLRGWTLAPGIRDMPVYHSKVLCTTAHGVRRRTEAPYAKPPGTRRIVVLGDSFTFGEDVSDDEAYPARLEQLLSATEVLNLGVHGYGHDQMLLTLREEGVRYQPDIVLLGFLYDDMLRNTLSFRDYAKPRFRLRGRQLGLTGTPLPPPEETIAAEPYRSKLVDLLHMLRARWQWRSGRTTGEMKRLTRALLDEIRKTADVAGARVVYAYLPVGGELQKRDSGWGWRERFFFDYCRERGIDCLDLAPTFMERRRAGVELKTWGHWGPLEHQIAAEAIAAGLRFRGLVRGRSHEAAETMHSFSYRWSRRRSSSSSAAPTTRLPLT